MLFIVYWKAKRGKLHRVVFSDAWKAFTNFHSHRNAVITCGLVELGRTLDKTELAIHGLRRGEGY